MLQLQYYTYLRLGTNKSQTSELGGVESEIQFNFKRKEPNRGEKQNMQRVVAEDMVDEDELQPVCCLTRKRLTSRLKSLNSVLTELDLDTYIKELVAKFFRSLNLLKYVVRLHERCNRNSCRTQSQIHESSIRSRIDQRLEVYGFGKPSAAIQRSEQQQSLQDQQHSCCDRGISFTSVCSS